MPVIDDPQSMIRCTNKVYLAERLGAAGVPTPRTLIVQSEQAGRRTRRGLGLPDRAQDSRRLVQPRGVQGRRCGGAQGEDQGDAGAFRPGDRAGVRADLVRLAHRRPRRRGDLRLPIPHGARALAGGQISRRQEPARRRLFGHSARPGAAWGHRDGDQGRQSHGRRSLWRRHEADRERASTSSRSTTIPTSITVSRTPPRRTGSGKRSCGWFWQRLEA